MNIPIYLTRIWNKTNESNKAKYIYIYAHQPHFYTNIFSGLSNISDNIVIYLLDSPPGMSGYRGFIETKKILLENIDIKNEMIKPIPFIFVTSGMINTLNESINLNMYLINHSIKDIMIVSTIFHLPRAFLSLLSVSKKNNNILNINCAKCGHFEDWTKTKYKHSQGLLQGTISELLECEIDRIKKYHAKGDLISIDDAINYLDK